MKKRATAKRDGKRGDKRPGKDFVEKWTGEFEPSKRKGPRAEHLRGKYGL